MISYAAKNLISVFVNILVLCATISMYYPAGIYAEFFLQNMRRPWEEIKLGTAISIYLLSSACSYISNYLVSNYNLVALVLATNSASSIFFSHR